MEQTQLTEQQTSLLKQLRLAASHQQWPEAEAISAQMIQSAQPALMLIGIEVLCQRQQWPQLIELIAAAVREVQNEADLNIRLLYHYAKNMAVCQRYQPAVYESVLTAPKAIPYEPTPNGGGRFQIIMAPNRPDALTIVDHQGGQVNKVNKAAWAGGESQVVLSQGGDPIEMLRSALISVQPHMDKQGALGILSVGDGYFLNAIGGIEKPGQLKQTSIIHVMEPAASLLSACFMVHDYTGSQGPLERENVFWHVGENWLEGLRQTLRENNKLPPPIAQLKLHPIAVQMETEIATVMTQGTQHSRETQARLVASYDKRTGPDIARRMAGDGPEKPRVLLPTSRFTTVLKYAAMKTARAFEALGWEARYFMEDADHERCSVQTIMDEIESFQPDLLFMLDHIRSEAPGMYPENLPIASWFQDHMPQLTSKKAGQAVTEYDFILTFAPSLFAGSYDYPVRQLIDMPMMVTEEHALPEHWFVSSQTHQQPYDFSYVSHVSGEPGSLLAELKLKLPESVRPVAEVLGRGIIAYYDEGGAIPTYHHLKQVVSEIAVASTLTMTEQLTQKMVEILWNPLNSALYRQQALGWAVDLADRDGYQLGIYGNGWEKNSRFKAYAQGPIEPGEPLAELSRKTRINLNLEPYACFSHNRLLDGLMAGGFFLVRDHPTNTLMQQLVNFLDEMMPELPEIQSTDQVLAHLPENRRAEFESLVESAACITLAHEADPVRQLASWVRAGIVQPQPEAIPHLNTISFQNREGFEALVKKYLNDADKRLAIAEAQRDSIKDRLTFKVCIKQTVQQIVQRLSDIKQ